MGELKCSQIDRLAAQADLAALERPAQRALDRHLADCAVCRERQERLRAFAALLEPDAVSPQSGDLAVIGRAILQAGRSPRARERRGPGRFALVAAALAMLVATGWALYEHPLSSVPESFATSKAPIPQPSFPPGDELWEWCPGVRGHAMADTEGTIAVSAAHRCVLRLSAGELRLRVDPEQRVRVSIRTPHAEVLVHGTVLSVHVDARQTWVAVERGVVEVRRGADTVLLRAHRSVRVSPQESLTPVNAPPSALVHLTELADNLNLPLAHTPDGDGASDGSSAVSPRDLAPESRGRAAPSGQGAQSGTRRIAELRQRLQTEPPAGVRRRAMDAMASPALSQRQGELWTIVAETHLAEGGAREALEAYGRVWRGPRSPTAANALIAGGDVALERAGQPERARGLYERYLAEYPTGSLREVASAGRCRAIARAGDRADTAECVGEYSRQYPDGPLGSRLQRLLE